MFRWLEGPGRVFKNPLPGSTNYLNAYDMAGNLVRAVKAGIQNVNKNASETKDEVAEDTQAASEGRKPLSEKLQEERKAARSKEKEVGLPPEKAEDLIPFPLNPLFRSHPVLSEELKDEIYKRVIDDKKSVRDVSAALGVEMKRVGAVVRLKAVEKVWEEEVYTPARPFVFSLRSIPLAYSMMRQTKSISLEDLHRGYQTINYNSLMIHIRSGHHFAES